LLRTHPSSRLLAVIPRLIAIPFAKSHAPGFGTEDYDLRISFCTF
jgi:hypothetical protein